MPGDLEEPAPRRVAGANSEETAQEPAPRQVVGANSETAQEGVVRSVTDRLDRAVSGLEPQRWTRNFHAMSICMGVNHAVEDLLFAYTTIVYRGTLGFDCNCLVFGVWALASMTLVSPVVAWAGSKAAIVLGLALYLCQYVAFVACSAMPDDWQMHALAYAGAVCCGVGAGLVYTAGGTFLGQSAQRIASASGEPLESKTAGLAAVFGFWSLGTECLVKVIAFVLQEAGVGMTATFGMGLPLALASIVAAAVGTSPVHGLAVTKPVAAHAAKDLRRCGDRVGAASVWLDAKVWLLSFLTVGFAFAIPFVNGIVGDKFVRPQLGKKYVALFSAGIALLGSTMQGLLRFLAGRFGNGFNIVMASVALALMPIVAFVFDARSLGWWLTVFYVLMGVVRAVWESTNKAVLVNHFPEPRTEAAFATMAMQLALSTCAGFFMAGRVPVKWTLALLLSVACMVAPGYIAACRLSSASETSVAGSPREGQNAGFEGTECDVA